MNYQVMPELGHEEYQELKNDIAARGVMVPIEYDEYGNVLDGHHRLQICRELGIADYPRVIRAGMSETEKRTHARKLNMARRHLTQEQRRELVRAQLSETPEKSDRQIAAGLGVSPTTAGTVRRDMESTGQLSKLDTSVGADGKEYPRQVQRPPVTIFNPTPQECENIASCAIILPKVEEVAKPHVAHNSGNNEWYTPAEYIEAAREVMGGIDLDPASCELANRVVNANRYYSIEDNGLTQAWMGRVWMNPPYAGDLIGRFVDKLAAHVRAGDVQAAIVLVNNATETAWFNTLIGVSAAVVFPRSRVRFYMPDGSTGAPLQGQAVVYIGKDAERFMRIFRPFGWGVLTCSGG